MDWIVKLKLDVAMRSREAMSSPWRWDARQPWLADAGVLCAARGVAGGVAGRRKGPRMGERMLVVRDNAGAVYIQSLGGGVVIMQ